MMISGRLTYLRPITEEDFESIYKATKDSEIRYMTGTINNFTLEDIKWHYERVNKDDSRYDFAICLKRSNEIIGDITISDIDRMDNKEGFRIALHNLGNLGKGYGTEAVKLAIYFAFEELKLNRLQLEVFSHNPRGVKAYEKAGFTIEGALRQSLYINNQYSDEIIMGILREEYNKMKENFSFVEVIGRGDNNAL